MATLGSGHSSKSKASRLGEHGQMDDPGDKKIGRGKRTVDDEAKKKPEVQNDVIGEQCNTEKSGPTADEKSGPTAGEKSEPTAGEKSGPTAGEKEHSQLQARTNKEERLRQTDRTDPRSGRVTAETRSRDVTRIQDEDEDRTRSGQG